MHPVPLFILPPRLAYEVSRAGWAREADAGAQRHDVSPIIRRSARLRPCQAVVLPSNARSRHGEAAHHCHGCPGYPQTGYDENLDVAFVIVVVVVVAAGDVPLLML